MTVTQQTFHQVLLEDPDGQWEVYDGELRAKPPMSFRHNDTFAYLGAQLIAQLDGSMYRVRINGGHVRRTEKNYFIPDVFVLPLSIVGPERDRPDVLEVYDAPLPLVVEVWSPSTGKYDVDTKLVEYQKRGDTEIWRVHPFERRVTVWRRRSDGCYEELVYLGGVVEPVALPGVRIDLDALFSV